MSGEKGEGVTVDLGAVFVSSSLILFVYGVILLDPSAASSRKADVPVSADMVA